MVGMMESGSIVIGKAKSCEKIDGMSSKYLSFA